jgi:hypothetical protein
VKRIVTGTGLTAATHDIINVRVQQGHKTEREGTTKEIEFLFFLPL